MPKRTKVHNFNNKTLIISPRQNFAILIYQSAVPTVANVVIKELLFE